MQGSFTGDGPVDAVFRAINAASGLDAKLREFRVDAITPGQDALGEVSVVVELGDQAAQRVGLPGVLLRERATGAGQAVATDIIEAAGIAYVRALTNAVHRAQALAAAPQIEPEPVADALIDAEALVRDAAALVSVPSVTGDERAALERLGELAAALGLEPQLHRHDLAALRAHPDHPGEETERDELWSLTVATGGAAPRLALSGHVDVVPPGPLRGATAARGRARSPTAGCTAAAART